MEENINVGELFEAVKRRWKIVAITVVVFVLLSIILSFFIIKPKYETNVKMFIGKSTTEQKQVAYDNNEVLMYENLLDTYANVIQTKDLVSKALEDADVNLKPEEVLKNLSVTPVANTQILEISYKDTNRERSVKVINSITNQFIKKSKTLITNGNIQVLETAQYPKSPVSPNKKMNIIIAFILGILASIGIIFVLEALDNTFKTKEEIEKVMDIPVIGIITEYDEKNGKQTLGQKGKKKHERRKR